MSSIPIHDEKLNAEYLQKLYREKVILFGKKCLNFKSF